MQIEVQYPRKILSDCIAQYAFWTHNGAIFHNIYELANGIEAMDEETFQYHVNQKDEKNDFALWILAVFGDQKLAKKLKEVMDKKSYLKIIKKRIKELENEKQLSFK